ncbi:MAG: hypothetical protein VX500_10350 [Planctomycetota bacterium]|nr:hypothetical protein [Planctomycetota bacterium]
MSEQGRQHVDPRFAFTRRRFCYKAFQVNRPRSVGALASLLFAGFCLVTQAGGGQLLEQTGADRQLQLNQGTRVPASLVGWKPDGIEMEVGESPTTFAVGGFISWGSLTVLPRESLVLLADGSMLAGQVSFLDADKLRLTSRLWGVVAVPRRIVSGWLVAPQAGGRGRALQCDRLAEQRSQDRVWLVSGDWLDGDFQHITSPEKPPQTVGVQLTQAGETLQVPLGRIWGISFGKPDEFKSSNRGSAPWTLAFEDGSLLRVRSWAVNNERWEAELMSGLEIPSTSIPADQLIHRIRGIRTTPATAIDLLEATPLQEGQQGWLQADWQSKGGRRPEGGAFQVSGEVFRLGRGVLGGSTLVYVHPQTADALRLRVGMDDSSPVEEIGIKIFIADANGKWQAQPIWETKLVRGRPPVGQTLRIDAVEVSRIAINTQASEDLGPAARVDWLELLAIPNGD